ncbi:MAG: DUF2254 domain-containing protein [Gammaproteobacteria bacterium]
MKDRIRFLLNRMRERLWVKPLVVCLLSILAAFIARLVDHLQIAQFVPDVSSASVKGLLTIMSASMLVIATFSVASMVSAYTAATSAATPRSFSLVIADDVTQNALSSFIGAFIFSIVALVALMNGYYGKAGRFTLFLITILVFAIVIVTFLRWVDRIARLGRIGTSTDKLEKATASALRRRRLAPTLGGVLANSESNQGEAVYANVIGYIQQINMSALQAVAEKYEARINVAALPGTFAAPGTPLAYVCAEGNSDAEVNTDQICDAFLIGGDRTFDDDPRFGIIALSEIASRALSPAVNNPGTAIDIIGTFVRLFATWAIESKITELPPVIYDRVSVPALSLPDMFSDAFNAIARDGAGTLEVAIRLQKALHALATIDSDAMRETAVAHARMALIHSELALKHPGELENLRSTAPPWTK